jgi:hypothetical protein
MQHPTIVLARWACAYSVNTGIILMKFLMVSSFYLSTPSSSTHRFPQGVVGIKNVLELHRVQDL